MHVARGRPPCLARSQSVRLGPRPSNKPSRPAFTGHLCRSTVPAARLSTPCRRDADTAIRATVLFFLGVPGAGRCPRSGVSLGCTGKIPVRSPRSRFNVLVHLEPSQQPSAIYAVAVATELPGRKAELLARLFLRWLARRGNQDGVSPSRADKGGVVPNHTPQFHRATDQRTGRTLRPHRANEPQQLDMCHCENDASKQSVRHNVLALDAVLSRRLPSARMRVATCPMHTRDPAAGLDAGSSPSGLRRSASSEPAGALRRKC
ncbi:hypothetical protein J2W24_004726 [Variovorax boronicumulans]|nr:hypothetical protein [Variovorax boronicumulans]